MDGTMDAQGPQLRISAGTVEPGVARQKRSE